VILSFRVSFPWAYEACLVKAGSISPSAMQARRTEILSIQSEVAQLPAVQRVNEHLVRTGGDIKAVNYTIAAWHGGNDIFNYCNLPARAPVYEGTCTPSIPYTLTSIETAPYACTAFPNGTTLSSTDCITQVDRQLDCQAVCECVEYPVDGQVKRGCSAGRFISCFLCINPDQLSARVNRS
jgi:hypothetical protein